MKNRTMTTLLVAVSTLLALADAASAYYSPRLGRFLSRDPLYEQGAVAVRLVGGAGMSRPIPILSSGGHFLPRDPAPSDQSQVNNLSFVANAPTNSVDVLGLDRYVVSDLGVHTGICVDVWQQVQPKICCQRGPHKGQWRKCFQPVGTRCFDFRTHVSSPWVIINIIPSIVIGAGDVVESGSMAGRTKEVTIKSRCKEDRALLDLMRDQVVNPDYYSLLFYNCNRWTETYIDYGLDGRTADVQCGGCDVDCK